MTQRKIWQLVGALSFLAMWQALALVNAGSFVIAGPVAVMRHILDNVGLLGRATATTLTAALSGFLLGNLAAAAMAALVVIVPRTERAVSFAALLVFCLPLVATGPILRVLFGTGAGPQITLAALAVYFTTFLALVVGLRAVPPAWTDLVRLYGRSRWTAFWIVRAPASGPYLLAGLQIAAPAAVLGAMIGEFTGAERGLGVLTLRAMRGLDVEATWAVATLAVAVSVLAYLALGWVAAFRGTQGVVLVLGADPARVRTPWLRRAGGTICIVAGIVLIWQITMDAFDLPVFFAKRPGDVWAYLVTGPGASGARATLGAALAETLVWTVPGYIAGLAMGAGLAAALTVIPAAAGLIMPLAIALRSVPIIATAPLLVLALGRGAAGTIVIVAVMIFFPTFVACLHGLGRVPGQVRDVFASYGAGRVTLLVRAQIPSMWPAFFAAARMAVPAALLAVTTTEWLATGRGIGTLMALTSSTSDYNMLWSAVVALSVVAVGAYLCVEAAERAVLRRYAAEQLT